MHDYNKICPFASLEDIKNKKITVMGLGLNGGGEACVRFFLKYGAIVTVTDMKTKEQLLPTIKKLETDSSLNLSNLNYVLGEHRIEDFENADCVIKNPGVKIEGNKFLLSAKNIETDISIFLRFTKSPIIAVTGSKGKSSTVSAIHYGLNQVGIKTFLGGNITVSPLTFLEETTEKTPVVLELSSWQLSDLRGRGILKPFISIITKIVPDHQNWYGNMEDYVLDKRLIYKNQDENCYSIFDFDEDEIGTGPKNGGTWGNLFSAESKANILRYTRKDLTTSENLNGFYGVFQHKTENGEIEGKVILKGMEKPLTIMKNLSVPGEHMRINVLNAALVLYLMKVDSEKIVEILENYQGIPHRLQYFYSYKNIKFYNDSCATVPEAVVSAVKSFDKSVILITGGTDKGLSFSPLTEFFENPENSKILPEKVFFLAGTGTDKIIKDLKNSSFKNEKPFNNFEECLKAVKEYIDNSRYENGKYIDDCQYDKNEYIDNYKCVNKRIVVFSPGATSFGMFSNEFDRGNKFMNGVKDIFI